jgi:hypothetical protein
MAEASVAFPITAEHFHCEFMRPLVRDDPALAAIERRTQRAIDAGDFDQADRLIAYLDAIDGDADTEQDDWPEREHLVVAAYGIDQTDEDTFNRPPIFLAPRAVIKEGLDWWQADNLRQLEKVGNW